VDLRLADIVVYPIKGCAEVRVAEAEVGPRGLLWDRGWMVVGRDDGRMRTQREHPRMATIEARPAQGRLYVMIPGVGQVRVPLRPPREDLREVTVWGERCAAIDCGEDAASLLSAALAEPVRLVVMPETTVRRVAPAYARAGDQVGFADGFPFLVTTEASLADLNRRLDLPVSMNRFRPNLVVSGGEPWAEDRWRHLRVGAIPFDVVKPCGRCAVITVDQASGVKGVEPLRTLARFRTLEGRVVFGQNLIHRGAGRLRIGDRVTVG